MGVDLTVRLHTDATTGRAMAMRRGLGKVRHIAVNELWLQEQVQNQAVTVLKIKNKFNLADLLTKYLSKDEIEHIVDYMQHGFLDGRSEVAPELSLLDDNSSGIVREWHADGVDCSKTYTSNLDSIQFQRQGPSSNDPSHMCALTANTGACACLYRADLGSAP